MRERAATQKGHSPPNRGKGRAIAFILAHVDYAGDDCVSWPMGRDWQGYGVFGYLNQRYYAHRYMCDLANGPSPIGKPFALHTCGGGHLGCVNPSHLRWGSPSDNQQDSVAHGTAKKAGGRRQKLTDAQIAEIRALAPTVKQYQLAERYGVRRETIGQILRGAFRKGLKPHWNQLFDPVARAAMSAKAKELRETGAGFREIGQRLEVSTRTARRLHAEAA